MFLRCVICRLAFSDTKFLSQFMSDKIGFTAYAYIINQILEKGIIKQLLEQGYLITYQRLK